MLDCNPHIPMNKERKIFLPPDIVEVWYSGFECTQELIDWVLGNVVDQGLK